MINIGDSFDQTLNKYGISAAWLSRQSGVNAQMISRFRNGKEIQTDTLEKLLDTLHIEARIYFMSLMMGGDFNPDLEVLVDNLSSKELHDLFNLVADRVVKRSKLADVA